MRYGNQLVTMAVVADRTRLRSVRDVIALIDLFGEDYGHRFGHGSQSPEAGIRITTIRVASYVLGDTVEFDAAVAAGSSTAVPAVGQRRCHFVGVDGAVDAPVYDENALQPGTVVIRPSRGYDTHDHVPGRARLAALYRRPRRDLVPQGHGARTR